MKFLVDRCAGRRVAVWLRHQGHDVREATEITPDPGDQALLRWAVNEQRILVTIDNDFGLLVLHRKNASLRDRAPAGSAGCITDQADDNDH
jgi:predicted nuclease of predicted toxin-antitoxin system